ncbi:MAG TPA: DUF5596 domain-containing protein [Firmicutes bacterium]|jgi:hypothetical protein|nr:DUF5596 domain-containing protein [Bacillota bacterium]
MTLNDVLRELGIPAAYELLLPHWEESLTCMPAEIPFLTSAEISESRAWAGLQESEEPVLLRTAKTIAENPALRCLAWHCYRLLYVHTEYSSTAKWPSLEKTLGAATGTFYLLIALAMIPQVRELHQSMGVETAVTRLTCFQISTLASNYRKQTGNLGISLRQIYWLRHYTAGRLFRLGRMEYMLRPFSGVVHAYAHKKTDRVIALAADGIRYDAAGYVASDTADPDPQGWTATLTETPEVITGYPISPLGFAQRQLIKLDGKAWTRVLAKSDIALEMHIPEGGRMTPDLCAASLRQTVPFFNKHFPEQPFQAITCSSWIFNTQIADLRLSSNNLVAFQQELYLFPVRSTGHDGLWFIFLQDEFDPKTAPRRTSLQREVLRYLEAGHRWRGGGMFFLTRHLERFGTQHYRTQASGPLPDTLETS